MVPLDGSDVPVVDISAIISEDARLGSRADAQMIILSSSGAAIRDLPELARLIGPMRDSIPLIAFVIVDTGTAKSLGC